MIYVSGKTAGSACVQLPNATGFAVNPRRFQASRRANAGNIIRQSSAYDVSSAEPQYDQVVTQTQAQALQTLHTASSSVYLTSGSHVYAAVMDLSRCEATECPGRWLVSVRFGIVSEVDLT